MKIRYKIEMLSDWHIGSGLDSGADADVIVLKDDNKLPYIPGKTIKGLLKDSLLEIADIKEDIKTEIEKYFGKVETDNSTKSGFLFFSNVELGRTEQKEIVDNGLSKALYKNIASTKIDERGIAQKASLRTMEVCIPVSLYGEIEGEEMNEELFINAFKWTRHIGVSRNRGLGRCKISII